LLTETVNKEIEFNVPLADYVMCNLWNMDKPTATVITVDIDMFANMYMLQVVHTVHHVESSCAW